MNKLYCIILLSFFSFIVKAQDATVGLIQFGQNAYSGYTLFSPIRTNTTFLIDECGKLIHEWTSDYPPGNGVYFLDNGLLLRAARVPEIPPISGGGYGGILQLLDWDSNVVWEYIYSNDSVQQHHDLEPLPNGNILILAWEHKTEAEAINAGRDPSLITEGEIWPEHLAEIRPLGSDSAEIVWRWNLWDHIVQDFDPGKGNYGIIADHPELLDLNYTTNSGEADWIHANSVDYNAGKDLILLSFRGMNEIFIIDHSTSTAEAAGQSGGNYGKGGDFLYRWGNPQVYDRGDASSKTLFGQHDAHWISDSLPDGGKILIFNNGFARPGGNYSSIDMIDPPVDTSGHFILPPLGAFGPELAEWSWSATDPFTMYTAVMGSSQRFPNGNTLICESTSGRFLEIDPSGEIVWEYINPVAGWGTYSQGETVTFDPGNGNHMFRARQFSPNFPGFSGQDLLPGEPLELNPNDYQCPVQVSTIPVLPMNWKVFPNPAYRDLFIAFDKPGRNEIEIYNTVGLLMYKGNFFESNVRIDLTNWPDGLYFVRTKSRDIQKFVLAK